MDSKLTDFVKRVKDALDIVDVVGEYTTLRKAGVNYKGICPFHNDHTPSMVVSKARQTYHCFVCGEHGDVIEFVKKQENLTFIEAVRLCARKANLEEEFPKREVSPEDVEAYKQREAQLIAIEAAQKTFQNELEQASSFLKARGYDNIHEKVLSDFGIGYAPSGNFVMRRLQKLGYSLDRLKEVNVVATTEDGRDYDRFRDRVMFPFYDLHGRVIGFSGRIVNPKEGAGKYVNTGETPLFTKGKNLFGLYQARKAIGKAGFAYLVEGQFDVMSLHRYGIENVIGGSGTAFTPDQVKLILRFTQNVVMIYDADAAGVKAALNNCELLLKAGANVKCVRLPKGTDPDEYARENKDKTAELLKEQTEAFPYALKRLLVPRGCKDEHLISETINTICSLVACVGDAGLRLEYIKSMAADFKTKMTILETKVREIRSKISEELKSATMQPGLYGMDTFEENLEDDRPAILTSVLQEFLDQYGDTAIIFVAGIPDNASILQLRSKYNYFVTSDEGCRIDRDGKESDYLHTLAEMYRSGITKISVAVGEKTESFVDFYIRLHGEMLGDYMGDKVPLISRCVELTSYADDTVVTVNRSHYCSLLKLTKGQFDDLRKPFVQQRKSAMKVNTQSDNLDDEDFDVDEPPSYVLENEDYRCMWKQYGYFPRLNKKGEPVCYMFRNKNGNGMSQVGDFYMTPLLHIFNDDFEQNKRVLRINRRYYETPIYIEVVSKALQKMSTIEDVLINYEAVNFSNGEEWEWKRIKEWMSRHYVLCSEIQVYGNQQSEGMSRREDEQFFAFSNGICHLIGNQVRFEPINEMGVVTHNKRNYYLPAFSTIYAGSGRKSDKYEMISQLVYREVPKDKQVSFETWADLMNQVYKINDNGKWAILFSIMCAFRSNIHCIDRLFTAPFFMGPMSSGKTQIAVSIRSLFVSPHESIFNLNLGTDAAMISYMSTFRDVPVVLDEYNNNDISATKFQALKSIVYDGDSKQKRKGSSGREIESDKVFAPVIICGQETPQRDDNALMSRVIICEVPKPKNRTREEVKLFDRLKEIEDPTKVGLSNVLMKILALRPMVMDHFRQLKQQAYEELKEGIINSGEMDRLMKTVSLFLGTVKLIEQYSDLRLPFTYAEFFKIAKAKIDFQLSLIRSTDKLAMFFTAVNNMIDVKKVMQGREFLIEQPKKVTGNDPRGEKKTFTFEPGKNVLFIRLNAVFSIFDRNGYNSENSTFSTIDQNLRSHPSYIGTVSSRRFEWEETVEEPDSNNNMVKRIKTKQTSTSAVILDYDVFVEMYNIDFRRSADAQQSVESDDDETNEDPSRESVQTSIPFPPAEEDDSGEPF